MVNKSKEGDKMSVKVEVVNAQETNNKPIIETIINTSAIALTGAGVTSVVNGFELHGLGVVMILLGMGLEFFKYWGRKNKYWG